MWRAVERNTVCAKRAPGTPGAEEGRNRPPSPHSSTAPAPWLWRAWSCLREDSAPAAPRGNPRLDSGMRGRVLSVLRGPGAGGEEQQEQSRSEGKGSA